MGHTEASALRGGQRTEEEKEEGDRKRREVQQGGAGDPGGLTSTSGTPGSWSGQLQGVGTGLLISSLSTLQGMHAVFL